MLMPGHDKGAPASLNKTVMSAAGGSRDKGGGRFGLCAVAVCAAGTFILAMNTRFHEAVPIAILSAVPVVDLGKCRKTITWEEMKWVV